MLTHGNLLANVRAIGEALAVRPTDVGISWLPLYHDMGLIGAWLMPLYFGLPVVVLSPVAFLTRPERWLRAIDRHRGTLTAAPNFAYELAVRKVTEEESGGLDLSSMRAMLNGAEPVNAKTLERFAARFAPHGFRREALLPVYGLAEASLAVTVPPLGRVARVDRVVRRIFEEEGRAVPAAPGTDADDAGVLSFVSVGCPLAGHEVRITHGDGREAAENTEGALWFRGPSTTGGYFRNEEASQKLFPEGKGAGWLQSGDRAYQSDGELFITGRNKEIILKAGRNLYPHEIEEIAGRVPGVRKGCVAAFGAADARGTERLVVAAETRERGAEGHRRIAAAITERMTEAIGLPPDAVELLRPHSIPKTSSGKLRRDHARKLYLAGSLGKSAPPAWLQIAELAGANAARTAGRWLRRGLKTLYGIYAAGLFIPWLAGSWLIVRLAPNRRSAAWITSTALRVYLVLVFCRVRVIGREHMATPGPARAGKQSCQLSRRAGADGGAGRGIPFCGQARGAQHAVHRFVYAQARPLRIRPRKPQRAFAPGGTAYGGAAQRRIRLRVSRRARLRRRTACGRFTWARLRRRPLQAAPSCRWRCGERGNSCATGITCLSRRASR